MGCLFVRDDVLFGLLGRSSASVEVRRRKGESKPQTKVLSKVWLMRLYVTNNDSLSFFSGEGSSVFLPLIWIVTSEAEQQKRDLKIAKDKLALTRLEICYF